MATTGTPILAATLPSGVGKRLVVWMLETSSAVVVGTPVSMLEVHLKTEVVEGGLTVTIVESETGRVIVLMGGAGGSIAVGIGRISVSRGGSQMVMVIVSMSESTSVSPGRI